jgi:hypothetical protein
MTLDEYKQAYQEALDEWARMEGLLKAFTDRVETLAFKMPPPNVWTPQFVQLCNYVRHEIVNGSDAAGDGEKK